MAIPLDVLHRLHLGRPVVAEVPVAASDMRAFVMVRPQVPSVYKHLEAWNEGAWENRLHAEPRLRDPSLISGYEVRYLLHHAKYTNSEWGWDYDYVLDDKTTRVKRVFVESEDSIEAVLAEWSVDATDLKHPFKFNSSLVNSPLDAYLDRPEERPHLWEE